MYTIANYVTSKNNINNLQKYLYTVGTDSEFAKTLKKYYNAANLGNIHNIDQTAIPLVVSENLPIMYLYSNGKITREMAILSNVYVNGKIKKNKFLVNDGNYKTEWGTDPKYYNSLNNINNEVLSILYSVSPRMNSNEDFKKLFENGDNKLSLKYDNEKERYYVVVTTKNGEEYVNYSLNENSGFVTAILNFCGELNNLGNEFLTINNKPAAMFMTNRIAIYSSLYNYDYGELIPELQSYLKTIDTKNYFKSYDDNGETWDEYARLFRKFIKLLRIRIIHE